MLTYQAVVPAPKHLAEADKQHWADTLAAPSSPPRVLTTWDHNKTLIWEQNPYYNGPFKPGIGFVKQIIGDGTNWFAAWQNHEIDMMANLDPAQLPSCAPTRPSTRCCTGGSIPSRSSWSSTRSRPRPTTTTCAWPWPAPSTAPCWLTKSSRALRPPTPPCSPPASRPTAPTCSPCRPTT